MDFIGAICLTSVMIPKTIELVSLFASAGILNWLISSDSQNAVVVAAYQSRLIHHDTTLLTLDQISFEELKYQVRRFILFAHSKLILSPLPRADEEPLADANELDLRRRRYE